MSQVWIDEMAALWFAKAQEGLSEEEKTAFEKWLHVNPLHQKTYVEFDALWQELEGLKPVINACQKRKINRSWLYGVAASVAFFFVVLFQWQSMHRLEFAQTMRTPVGKMQAFTLNDGTTLFLDTDTHISVHYYVHERVVTLHQGQIVLQVTKNEKRPLLVEANTAHVKVTGTLFEVRHVEDEVRVSVEEGSVEVSYKRPHDGVLLKRASLRATEQITLDERGFVTSHNTLQNNAIAPWRKGRLVFDKTSLDDALFEFERYGAKPVVIESLKLAQMPLSGSFEIERFASFVELLPKVLPLKVVTEGEITRLEPR